MPAKRILILTNRVPYPLKDGGNLAMKAMIDGYKVNGWEVYLLSMNTTRHYVAADLLEKIYKDITAFETVDVDNGVRLLPALRNFFFSSEPNHAARFRDHAFREKLVEVLKSFRPGVVQVESPYLSVYMQDIKRLFYAFTVLRMHNVEYQVWGRLANETSNPIKRFYLRNLANRIKRFEEKIWGKYDLLLPITHIDEAVVKALPGHAETHTVPFGIDLTGIPPKAAAEKWAGYHIGAMDWLPNREGIDWFIKEVWPTVRQKAHGFEFYFAGRNMPPDLQNISIAGIHSMGEVADASEFIADKKMLIVPIRSGGGIRVKILEAMAAGKIVISTTVGMQGIEAVDREHFLKANTVDEFSDAISWCLNNKEAVEKIAEMGRLLIEKHYDGRQISRNLSETLITRLKALSA